MDIRFAHPATLFGKPLFYGLTFNNAPTITDLWNTIPAWGFPYIHSNVQPGPVADDQIDALGGEVYGIGAYGALNITPSDMLYTEADLYKSLPNHLSYALGVGPAPRVNGVIPYVRLAFQHTWANFHPPRSLAWLAWIVARLGGWNSYYKSPGLKTMRA